MRTETNTGRPKQSNAMHELRAGERTASTAGGVVLAAYALRTRLILDIALLAAGGYLIYRGTTGRCPLSDMALRRRDRRSQGANELDSLLSSKDQQGPPPADAESDESDEIDEASKESFPTGDPPASTRAAASPSQRHGKQ